MSGASHTQEAAELLPQVRECAHDVCDCQHLLEGVPVTAASFNDDPRQHGPNCAAIFWLRIGLCLEAQARGEA